MPDAPANAPADEELTVLGPVGDPLGMASDERLAAFYAYPEQLQTCWVRANMIASLDGGATDEGKAGGLAGAGDRALFGLMRSAADVILVGAATVRIEDYSGAQLSVAQRQLRASRGQTEVPQIAVVTRSGDLDRSAKLFTRTTVPPLVLTCTHSFNATCSRLGAAIEVIDASTSDPGSVDPAAALRVLADRGLLKVLTEGGPHFLSLLIEHGLLDELCLTIAPILVGGNARRIAAGPEQVHVPMRRTHLLSDEQGYLYTRYVKHTRYVEG